MEGPERSLGAKDVVVQRNEMDWENARDAAATANPDFIAQAGKELEAEVRRETDDFRRDVNAGAIARIVERALKKFEGK
jgi:hypothetical protein